MPEAPPQSIENGPNTPQPSTDDFWVPGNYQYVATRYVWRPGYWTVARPNWIWTPAHYVWTPSGYIFLAGHWDYVLARRGVLFAPVYFSGPVYVRRHFVFAPSVVIDSSLLTVNFFVRPNYYHYYFGDYYGDRFVSLGFTPWFSVGARVGYDPLFTYYRWDHRADRRWQEGLHEHYAYMNAHPNARPPRTFAQQKTMANNLRVNNGSDHRSVAIGAPLNQYARTANNGPAGGAGSSPSPIKSAAQISREAVKTQDFSRERARMEAAPGGNLGRGAAPKTLDLHRIAGNTGGQLPGTKAGGATAGTGGAALSRGGEAGGRTTGRGITPRTGAGSGRATTDRGGSDPFHLKSGERVKSGSSGGRFGSGAGSRDDRGRGTQGDSRDRRPDDRGTGPGSGNGRFLFVPGNSAGAVDDQAADAPGDAVPPRGADPVGPLTISPRLILAQRAMSAAAESGSVGSATSSGAEAYRSAPQLPATDPVRPLTIVPHLPPSTSVWRTGASAGVGLRGAINPQAKDPIQPLRIAPPSS